jgi:hypothetical protein
MRIFLAPIQQIGMEGGGGGKAWPARGPTYAQVVLESWLQHTQDLLDMDVKRVKVNIT